MTNQPSATSGIDSLSCAAQILELHHFFILTEPLAPEAELHTEMGLIEGPPNDHPGQGTDDRRFFFCNSALELLYVRDAAEAEEGPARRLRFPERATQLGASPFGLVLSRQSGTSDACFPG